MASLTGNSILPPNFFQPKKGHTFVEEMECYSLPYGGLGFTSHILTYYTVIILANGRSPLRPWKKLVNTRFDLVLSTIGLVGGFALAVFTLVRCRNHWELLLVGIWKLSMSLFNGVVGVHVSYILRNVSKPSLERGNNHASYHPLNDDDEETASRKSGIVGIKEKREATEKEQEKDKRPSTGGTLFWVLLYMPGMIAGFTGLISLIIHHWKGDTKLHIITYVFGGVLGFCVLIVGLAMYGDGSGGAGTTAMVGFLAFTVLAALYGDWALGAMADNLLGTPSGDSSGLYWSYFILKRLTMCSS